jgi:uncharacterized membrane protein YdfJ with MMPL/SSD domain
MSRRNGHFFQSTLIAVGLIALAALPVPAFRTVGPIGGVAVLLALVADLVVLPALMSLLDDLEQPDT